MTRSIKLYGYWRSGCSWRVRIALALLGIEYENVPVNLLPLVGNTTESLPSEYIEKNNMEQLPTLEIEEDGTTMRFTQSLPIIEYLDEISSSRSIIGNDAYTRFKSREIAEVINSGIQPLQNLGVLRTVTGFTATPLPKALEEYGNFDSSAKGMAKFHIVKGLYALEQLLQQRPTGAGPYCAGTTEPSLGDICLVPQMYNARRFMIDVDKYFPLCVAVDRALSDLPAFQAAHADAFEPDAKP